MNRQNTQTGSRGSTICMKMWDSVFIDVTGDVFFCCRRSPSSLGNIYHQHLDDIWRGEIAGEYRHRSLSGQLACHKNCTLLSKALKATSSNVVEARVPALRKVHLEHHEYCNIACIMCYQRDGGKPRHIPNETIKNRIDFSSISEVQLQGGEPLAYKPCRELFHWLVEELGIPVTLQTNALLIDDALARLISERCTEIMIALNAATAETHELVNFGSNWSRVLRSIRLLQETKTACDSELCIEGQMTLVRENVHELPDFIRFAEQIGLDSISVSWEESVPEYLGNNPALFQRIRSLLQPLLSSSVFKKQKHPERLGILFDIGSDNPQVRPDQLPLLQRTVTYRERWEPSGENATGESP